MARAIIRTMPLRKSIRVGDRDVLELEFSEPTGQLFDEIEKAQAWNEVAKKRSDIVATSAIVLEHLTGLKALALANLDFDDRRAANDIAGEIMGAKMGVGES